ncbi:MAG: hypothetical protein QNJ13_07025 [Paracoccaceae bacterium]|nr:hypothetical protein [Paracoccaceae bacterium]
MYYASAKEFQKTATAALGTGPVAIVVAEDDVEIETTIRHNLISGFRTVVLFAPDAIPLAEGLRGVVHRVRFDTLAPDAVTEAVNAVIEAAPEGTWLSYGYNAEYLFYPFAETRTVGEMLAFHAEERREAMLAYVIDLYAADLDAAENAVSLDDAHLDRTGYYALGRDGPDGLPLDRQLDFFGGLRWRYEEHIPETRRKIDRIALFRARRGLRLLDGYLLNDDELNTYACPWHNNLTAAICSFRTAKALRSNPGSRYEIDGFHWHNSVRFEWDSRQLLDLGLMEPGQWF